MTVRIKCLDPLRAKKIYIRNAEDVPYLGFGYTSLISDPIRSGKRSQRKILDIGKFNKAIVLQTDISRKITQVFQISFDNESKRMTIFEFSE